MPDPVVLETILDTGPTVPRAEAAERAMRKLGKATDEVLKRFAKFGKMPGFGGGGGRGPGRPIEDATKKLERLTRQTQLAKRIASEHGTSVQAASRAVRAFGKDVNRAAKEAAGYAVSLDRAEKEARQLAAEQRKAAKSGGMFSGIAGKMAKGLIAVGAAALTAQAGLAAVRGSIVTYAELEDQLLGTQAVTRASASEMQRLSDQAKELGATTPRTAVEIAGLQQELARAGFTIEETLQSTAGLIAFASAGQLELGEATGFAATILRAFDKDVSQLGNVTDILAVSASGAKTDIAQLASAFEFAAAPAASIGASLEETSAALAVIQERGVKGTKAGRGLNAVFRELSKETARGTAVLDKAKLSYDDINISVRGLLPVIETLADKVGDDFVDAIELVGSEAAPAFLNMIRGVEKFGELTDENMTRAAGRTQEMADVMESGLGGASRRLKSAAEGVQVAFGEGIAPALEHAAGGMAQFLAENQDMIRSLGELSGFVVRVAGAFAEMGTEILSVVTATRLVRDMEREISGIVTESEEAREQVQSWQEAMESASGPRIRGALADAQAVLSKTEESLAALNEEAKAFPENSQGFDVIQEKMRPLREEADRAKVFVAKLGRALEGAGDAAAEASTPTSELRMRLTDLQKQIRAVGDEEKIRQDIEERFNAELDESLRRTEDNRQELLELELQALSTGQAFDTLADRMLMPTAEGISVPGIDDAPVWETDPELFFPDEAEMKRITADFVDRRAEQLDEIWMSTADTAFEVAQAIGGEWGDMLGGIIDGVMGIRDAFKAVQSAGGGLQGLMAGAGLGQAAGGLVGQLGISTGRGQAGGALSGIFGGVGTALGGPIGGIVGGIVGELVGGLDIFASGGDDAVAQFQQSADGFVAVVTKLEGSLEPAIQSFGNAVIGGFQSIVTSLGGTVESLAAIDVKIREQDGELTFRVREFGKTVAEFESEAAAVGDAIRRLLQQSEIEGLSENLTNALQRSTAASFQELADQLARVQLVDQRLMSEGEKFLAERTRLLREEIQALAGLGVSMNDVIEGRIREEEAMARQAEASALALAGVDTSLAAGLQQIEAFREQAAAQEELNQVYADAAANANDVATATGDADFAAFTEGLEGIDFEGAGMRFRDFGGSLGDLEAPLTGLGEVAEVTAREIDGIDLVLLEKAAEALTAKGLGGFFRQLAEASGDAELAARATELENRARLLQLQLTFEQVRALGLLTEAEEAWIEETLGAIEQLGFAVADAGGPARAGGTGQRRQRREAILGEFAALGAEADEAREGVRGLAASLSDFRETMAEARKLGKIGADVLSDAWRDFIVVAQRAALDGVQGATDMFRGVSDLGGALAASAASFDDARGQLALLTQAAAAQGIATGDLVAAQLELVEAEKLAADVLVARGLADELAAVGVALDPEEVRKLAAFEFELARVRAVNALVAAEQAGALERLGLDFGSLMERVLGAELPALGAGDGDGDVRQRFDDLDSLMASLADGIEVSIMKIGDETAVLLENATNLGASVEQLAAIQGQGVESLLALGEAATGTVQAELDAAAGLDTFRIKLRETDERFDAAADSLRRVIAAMSAADGDVSELERDLRRLEVAARVADREVARGLVDSFQQLGVALPVELTQALAAAEFEEARVKALATVASLEARGAFEALGVSAEELTLRLINATFGAQGADVTGATSRGFRRAVRGGGAGATEDLGRLRQEVLDTIRAWTGEDLGDATRQAVGFAQALAETRLKAERAGVALNLVDDAFDDLRRTFVDRQLAGFESGLSEIDRELLAINDRFTDILSSFMTIGAEAEDFARAGEAFATAIGDVEDQLKVGIREQLAELRAEDPTVTSREMFEESQARFRELAAAARGGDLEAVAELGPAAAAFREQIAAFLGGRGVVGVEALISEITGALEAVEAEELIPRDIAALEAAAASLASIDTTTQGQPTAVQTSDGFSSVSSAVNAIDFGGVTALISPDDLQTLLEGLGADELSRLVTEIGALPFSELVDALGADFLVSFGPEALSELATAIGSIDVTGLAFDDVVTALGGIGTPIGDLVAALGPEGFQAFVNALSPIASSTAAAAVATEAAASSTAATAAALTLEAEGAILNKLSAIRVATEGAEVGLRGQVWVKTWLSRQLDAARDLNRRMQVPGYLTGGLVPATGPAFLHRGERVLSPPQTRRFEEMGGLDMLAPTPQAPVFIPQAPAQPQGGDSDDLVAEVRQLRRDVARLSRERVEAGNRQAVAIVRQTGANGAILQQIAGLKEKEIRERRDQLPRAGRVGGATR